MSLFRFSQPLVWHCSAQVHFVSSHVGYNSWCRWVDEWMKLDGWMLSLFHSSERSVVRPVFHCCASSSCLPPSLPMSGWMPTSIVLATAKGLHVFLGKIMNCIFWFNFVVVPMYCAVANHESEGVLTLYGCYVAFNQKQSNILQLGRLFCVYIYFWVLF